jgi:FAD:protein FMN transferase
MSPTGSGPRTPARSFAPIAPPHARRRFGEASWEALGTRIVLRLTDTRALDRAREAVEQELDAIDRACSRFRCDSEIARVNASAGATVRVSPLLAKALELALRAAALTDGDVDPTVGSALALSGYDRDWRLLDPPDARHLDGSAAPGDDFPTIAAHAVCGWRSVMFDRAALAVRVPAGFTIDLGATAKAWVADRGAQAAAQAGDCGALVGVGGDIAVSGRAPKQGWAVHVTDDHRSAPTAPGQTVTIRSGGLATSSTTVRRWRHAGRTMHHIIDPATGAPVRGTWRTVSVAAASCADANIATTSALVRAGAAPAWLVGLGVPARLVSAGGRVYTVGGWPAEDSEMSSSAACTGT